MKVLHLISGGDKGGAKTHMFALLDEQVKICDVTVVCLMRGVFYEEIIKRDVHVVLLEQKSRFDLSVVGELSRMINDDGYDILNAHGARANFIAAKLIGRISVPVVTTVHSDYKLDFDSLYKKAVFRSFNISALKKIRFKIAVSDAFREMLISRGFMPNDILTVYNGMDFGIEIDPMPREEFAEKHGIPFDRDTVYVGIAARFDRVKGVDVFLRAAAKALEENKNLRFVIAGEGDERGSLTALAEELGIRDRVHFIGFVSPIYDFLNFIDVNCLTSRSESFPYSILEGARLRKPTVAAAVGGIPHLIINGSTGFTFPSEDHITCAARMTRAAGSPELREKVGNALYDKASSEFSNRALAEKYLENYRSIIRKYRREKRYDVILSGYYGFGNFGDEIILATIIRKIREDRPEYEIAVLSRDPMQTALKFGVDCFPRLSLRKVKTAMRTARAYVNGGGTLMTDVTSTHSLVYYLAVLRMAKKRGLRTMLLANGIGPFLRQYNEKRALKELGSVDVITLRDRASYEYITSRLPGSNASQTSDVVFTFCNAGMRDAVMSSPPELPEGVNADYFVVSLRDSSKCGPGFEDTAAEVCRRICGEYGLSVVILPMQYEKDRRICSSVARKIGKDAFVIPEDYTGDRISLFAHARFVLGMRLHSLMLAAALSVPLAAISYDIKIENFVKENELGPCFDVTSVRADDLYESVKTSCLSGYGMPSYNDFIAEIGKRCEINWEKLFELIDGE